jgi:hypothetical protein
VFGNQFIRESDGLIQINLDSSAALINLKLTEGALQDSDSANDLIAAISEITLEDANYTGDSVGSLQNPVHTSVDDLTIYTNAGSMYGSQFILCSQTAIQVNSDSAAAIIDPKTTEGRSSAGF